MAVTTHFITKWVNEVFKNDNFKEINIKTTGNSENGEGFIGEIAFVEVQALTPSDEIREFNLAIKYGKQNEDLRKKIPIRLLFQREIFFYRAAIPVYQRFEKERNANILEKFIPKCFGTFLYENQEILVLENLKAIGYELHDQFQPMNVNHLRLTFESYGKWHGLSMAFRDQKPQKFNELYGDLPGIRKAFLPMMESSRKESEKNIYDMLRSRNETELIDKLQGRFKQGLMHEFRECLEVKEENSVLLHEDCWNNNLMFKYDDLDKKQPKAVKFLDFQLTKLGPPVCDLAYHLYSTASEKEFKHFKELLQIYYLSLSKTIKSLGSDPEKIFPYSELIRQWNRYSSFGITLALLFLPIVLSNKEDTLDIQDSGEEKLLEILENVKQKNMDKLSARSIGALKHYLQFTNL